jgi:predicted TIM-barrel fold metal-dependent hydrolase
MSAKYLKQIVCLWIVTGLGFATLTQAQTTSKELAEKVPIADVHRHVQRWVSPEQLKQQMQEQNIGWSGAVGAPFGPWDTAPYAQLLGKKYIATAGQVELSGIYAQHGASGLTDINLDTYKTLLQRSDKLFADGRIKGFGELILNNQTSNPMVSFRRKVNIDSAPIEAMFKIAAKHKGFVQIHSEDDADSVDQIKALAAKFPDVAIILSHCLLTGNVDLIKSLLTQYQNLYCEMSARSKSHYPNVDNERIRTRVIYGEDFAKAEWLKLIDALPTRFMVGTDTYNPTVNFEQNIAEIRQGLLARLQPASIELVAYKNAVKVMRLD